MWCVLYNRGAKSELIPQKAALNQTEASDWGKAMRETFSPKKQQIQKGKEVV